MKLLKHVTIVPTNVLLVPIPPPIVPNVHMIADLQNQLVTVKKDTSTSIKIKNVLHVM
jgi:hypothetical protein